MRACLRGPLLHEFNRWAAKFRFAQRRRIAEEGGSMKAHQLDMSLIVRPNIRCQNAKRTAELFRNHNLSKRSQFVFGIKGHSKHDRHIARDPRRWHEDPAEFSHILDFIKGTS
jgi:hypothetical protein